jgi:CheY-like chemotaxis protein
VANERQSTPRAHEAGERLAHTVRLLLDDEGYDARVATDGATALQILAEWHADIVLLDLFMPRLDGWGFLKRRAESLALQRTPVLVWSVAPMSCK